MRAEIKRLFSSDVEDLEHFVPPDPTTFSVVIRLMAGPQGGDGEESFDFVVCSPSWLETTVNGDEPLLLRHKLLMRSFDFAMLRKFVERFVRGCEADSWDELADKLSRLGHWEFEDYRE